MKIKKTILPFMAIGIMFSGMVMGSATFADERGEREESRERDEKSSQYAVAENAVYKQECSSCHFLYLPGLLPARSWQKIMNETDKHFGENLALDEKTKAEIQSFLTANSAEKVNTEWAGKVLSSSGSGTPARITEVPYIVKEHRKIKEEVFKRKSIASRSNCGACHQQGAQGNFEEDAVSIPGK
jgi:mono/diheme cytochrome c family protein